MTAAGEVHSLAMSFDGQPVPTPPGTDPAQWAGFVRWVVPVHGGCFFWMGKLFGAGYGRHQLPTGPGGGGPKVSRLASAHRYAWTAFNGGLAATDRQEPCSDPQCAPEATLELFTIAPAEREGRRRLCRHAVQHVLHRCDEPLCAPVTAAGVTGHLFLGDATVNAEDRELKGRGGRHRHAVRRHGADTRERHERSVKIQVAIRAALALGIGADGLLPVVQEIYRDGDPNRDQLGLLPGLPQRRLSLVR